MLQPDEIIGKKILVLTAHPDDESFLAAGTIFANNQSGAETYLVCATLGEKGTSHLDEELTPEQLQEVRKQELHKVCAELGMTKDYILQFPDGQVNEHEDLLFTRASEICEEIQPELILSFGADGITGHKDHVAVSRVAKRMSEQFNLPLATFCIPKKIAAHATEWIKSRRKTLGHYDEAASEFQEENICITIDGELKLKVLKYYCSQIDQNDPFHGFPTNIANTLLHQECFYLTRN